MPPTVWLNGSFLDPADAKVSAFDAGFQHGVGLFETMLAIDGEPVRVERHIRRLVDSARDLGLSTDLRARPLVEAVRSAARRANLPRARVRLTITGGDLNMLQRAGAPPAGPHDPTILIVAQPATEYPAEMMSRGVMATVADPRVNPLDPSAGHKTLNYWTRLRALQAAAARGAGETILLQVTNHLAGGAVSNLFVVKDGVVRTPLARGEEAHGGLPSPVLPGVTRAFLIEQAQEAGMTVERKLLTIADLLDADEAFLTNSSWGVLPVVHVEQKQIGAGSPGPVAAALRDRWLASLRDAAEDAASGGADDVAGA